MTDTPPESAALAEAKPVPTPAPAADQAASPPESSSKSKPKPRKPPGSREPAQRVLERLFELYPKMFGARFLPLKLGVFQELTALHPDEFKKEDLKAALGLHARSTRYLESVASGEKRHDLNGEPVEDVATEHVHHAIMEVFRRRQARSREDLRPWLHSRLVKAIQASGLGRDEYEQRIPTADPVAAAALQDAFAEIGRQAAKREALQRAFESSGRSVAEFAEMYGLAPAEVERALKAGAP
jgi:ProP effector